MLELLRKLFNSRRVPERTAQLVLANMELQNEISQRKRVDERFRLAVESAPNAMVMVNQEGKVILVNSQTEKLFGYHRDELMGQMVDILIPNRFRGRHPGYRADFFANPEVRPMGRGRDLHGLRKDGSEFPVEIGLNPIETDEGTWVLSAIVDITERKRAEEVHERLAAVVDSSNDAIISKNLDGTITAWNYGAEKLFGYSSAEAVGKPILMLLPPDRASEESDILARIRHGESVEHFETVRVRKDRKRIDVSATISPIKDSSGAIVGASKIARDITERKQAEQRLRESEGNYRTLFDSMDEGFCTIEVLFNENNEPVDYRFLEVNPAFEKQTGIQNAPGRRMREIAPKHEEHWFAIYGKIALTGEPARFENVAAQLHRSYDVHAFRVGEPQERKVAILFNDITERKRTEETLREQAQVMESAQVFVRDMQSRVVFWPRGAEKVYGFKPEEALGVVSHDLFHTQFPEPLEAIEKKLFETGMWEGELIHRTRDGSTITVSSAWALHRDSQGRPVRILETNVDITASKEARKELARSRQALEDQTLLLQSVLDSISEGLVVADERCAATESVRPGRIMATCASSTTNPGGGTTTSPGTGSTPNVGAATATRAANGAGSAVSPSPSTNGGLLAFTGQPLTLLVLLGVGLIVAGGAILTLRRRLRAA